MFFVKEGAYMATGRLERIEKLLDELKELQEPFESSTRIHSTPYALMVEGILDDCNQGSALLIAHMAIEKARQKAIRLTRKFVELEKLDLTREKTALIPFVTCSDGFYISIQGHDGAYSKPRAVLMDIYGYDQIEICASEPVP